MDSDKMVEKLKTYIDGFDETLGGGIPKGHVVLVCGTPGTMKTSVTFSIMYENAKRNKMRGMYLSLEEGYDGLKGAMEDLGMDGVDDLELYMIDVGKIRLGHQDQEHGRNWLGILSKYIQKRVEQERFDIIVVDSLAALYSLAELSTPRVDLFHFIRFLKELDSTVVLISEIGHGNDSLVANNEDFLADGIIYLKLFDVGETEVQLRIRCVKMRRTKHEHGWLRLLRRNESFITTPVLSE
ncbi:MAG: AAA family ATPase [Thermoplasmata archaeon]|nr:AAA family ATPase [Thermoplasmata archaeon]